MDDLDLLELLRAVREGTTAPEDALRDLQVAPVRRLRHVAHDAHRAVRRGLAEAIYAAGKSQAQLADAVRAALATGENCLVTRATPEQAAAVLEVAEGLPATWHEAARMVTVLPKPVVDRGRGVVLVMTAGTSDVPVAEEAAVTCEALGNRVRRAYDTGVAGLHRLLEHADAIADASVIVVAAGMEGALPGVVAGLAPCPVIGVPTSVGYGTSFGGLTALLAMLNSCAGGVTVVNVDNGFGAGVAATLMNRKGSRES